MGVVVATALAALVPSVPSAQQKPLHFNPAIEKLAEGKPVLYTEINDFSLSNARQLSRGPFDYIFLDQEHTPLDFNAVHMFVTGMMDKETVLKKRSLQPNSGVWARFPTDSGSAGWFVKQALDIGLMGIYFPLVESQEQALSFVKSMRYPQPRGSKIMEPAGVRGKAGVPWNWGLPAEEYYKHADLWPLNPEGDLFAVMMIESVAGLKNADAIASVPGVGALTVAATVDLSTSMGIPVESAEVEEAVQGVLKVCKARKIFCAIARGTRDAEGAVKRIREGWNIINTSAAGAIEARRILGVPK